MKTLLLLGDSLIEWGDWPVLLPDYVTINKGIAGEMVEGLSARLAEDVLAVKSPDFILIMAGTNNLLMGNFFFPAIFSTMLLRLQQLCPQATITVNAILPMDIPELNQGDIHSVHQELQQVVQSVGVHFLDMDNAFYKHCLPITHPCFLPDGVHLSTRGYQVWAKAIHSHLQGL